MLPAFTCAHLRRRKYASGEQDHHPAVHEGFACTCLRMHASTRTGLGGVGMQDKRWSMTCRDTLFMSVSADCSNGQRRDEQQRGGERVQAAFDNWLRDRHQNEIMLVNLSSINYFRSRLQYIHYSRKSTDPAGREKQPYHIHNAYLQRCCNAS